MVGRLIRASLFRGDVGVADDVKIAMSVGANSLRIRRYAAGVLESINVTPGGSAIETAADQPGRSAAALDSNVGIAHRKNARGGMGKHRLGSAAACGEAIHGGEVGAARAFAHYPVIGGRAAGVEGNLACGEVHIAGAVGGKTLRFGSRDRASVLRQVVHNRPGGTAIGAAADELLSPPGVEIIITPHVH